MTRTPKQQTGWEPRRLRADDLKRIGRRSEEEKEHWSKSAHRRGIRLSRRAEGREA